MSSFSAISGEQVITFHEMMMISYFLLDQSPSWIKNKNVFCSNSITDTAEQYIVNLFCYRTGGVLAVVGVLLSSVVDLGSEPLAGPNQKL
jgi:hypothetical protein